MSGHWFGDRYVRADRIPPPPLPRQNCPSYSDLTFKILDDVQACDIPVNKKTGHKTDICILMYDIFIYMIINHTMSSSLFSCWTGW